MRAVRLALIPLLITAGPAWAKGTSAPLPVTQLRLEAGDVLGSEPGAEEIPGLLKDEGKAWPPFADGIVRLSLRLPATGKDPVLVQIVVKAEDQDPVRIVMARARKLSSRKAKALAERHLLPANKDRPKDPRSACLLFPPGKARVARLIIGSKAGLRPSIVEIRLYKLDRKGRSDVWVFLGSGITVMMNPRRIEREIRARFPGRKPLVINRAVSGWGSRTLAKEIPGILREYSFGRFFPIHIGGVNVSSGRPWPGGSKVLQSDLKRILELILKARKEPILARLSYRAYKAGKGKPKVPPESNGSGPYVKKLFDPMIRKYCPRFFDRSAERGAVDLYGWFKEHPKDLGDDGVIPNGKGQLSMLRHWVERAGAVIYDSPPLPPKEPEKKKDDKKKDLSDPKKDDPKKDGPKKDDPKKDGGD